MALVCQRLGGAAAPFRTELYRASDAGQTHPVVDQPERTAAMLARLERYIEKVPRESGVPIELDARTLEHLRALGYVD